MYIKILRDSHEKCFSLKYFQETIFPNSDDPVKTFSQKAELIFAQNAEKIENILIFSKKSDFFFKMFLGTPRMLFSQPHWNFC